MLIDIPAITEAAVRAETRLSDMAIRLAVGHTLHRLGETVIEVSLEDLNAFIKDYRVDVSESDGGTRMTYRVVKR